MNNNSTGAIIAMLAFIVLLIAGAILWQVYSFKECKKVGHSTLYCVMRSGK